MNTDNIEKLAEEFELHCECLAISGDSPSKKNILEFIGKAQKKLPTWDDVEKAIYMARQIGFRTYIYDTEEIINQLKQNK